MARGQYRETPEQRALRQLIEYAEDTAPIGVHMMPMPTWWMTAGDGAVTGATYGELFKMSIAELEALRLDVRALLRFLAGADSDWRVATRVPIELWPARTDPMPGPPGGRRRRGPAKPGAKVVTHFIHGTVRNVLLYQVVTLLVRVGGVERLRLCPAPDCGRSFLKVGRRDFCSDRCRRRVFLSTYDPFAAQPRRPDRPTATRTRTRK
jgi:hypothetical protein